MRKLFFAAVILLILGAGSFAVVVRPDFFERTLKRLSIPDSLRSKTEVRIATVSVEAGRSADATVVATGYLKSRQQAKIGARAAGRIEEIKVEEGSEVVRNDLIAVLEHNDMDAAMAAAKATVERSRTEIEEQKIAVERAKRELNRAEELFAKKTMVASDFDVARFTWEAAVARVASLEASLALAEARLQESHQLRENMFIRAPFDGTVISKDAEVGESILPGGMGEASGRGSVVTIADLKHLEVDCDVKEDYISRVIEDQETEIAVDAVPDVRFKGRVRKIIPMGDRARATIKVKVEVLDSDRRLFPEMSSTVFFLPAGNNNIAVSETPRVFCPVKAVTTRDGQSVVFVVSSEDRLRQVVVKPGETRDGRTEILEGLSGGEEVVIAPGDELKDGSLVKTAQ